MLKLLSRPALKVTGVYFGLRLIAHPSSVEMCDLVFVLSCWKPTIENTTSFVEVNTWNDNQSNG